MINITDPLALDFLAEVEGDEWKRQQLAHMNSPQPPATSFFGVLAEYNERYQECVTEGEDPTQHEVLFNGLVIYGEGGYARYRVSGSGEIALLRSTTRVPRVQKAMEMGISVW